MPYLTQDMAPPARPRSPAGQRKACCTAHETQEAPAAPLLRRARLSDLDGHVHCSIIGTCIGTGELRKLIPRHDPAIDRKTSSDLDIHHAAVNLSTSSETAARELTKALDTRHAQAIRRFKGAQTEAALGALWRDAMANGDVPGAYWALMTHPLSTYALRSLAFGDVHMLSHLVGAANRADIRRLAALEEENAQLRSRNALLQRRLDEANARHEQAAALAEERATRLHGLRARLDGLQAQDAVRASAHAHDSLAAQRCADAEARLAAQEQALETMRRAHAQRDADLAAAGAEVGVLEAALARAIAPHALPESTPAALPPLAGMAIAYVGGRQQSTLVLARLVADAGGELLLHDGGIEDRKGLLASTLARAQLVVYPVDCISHNAMHIAKQTAARKGIPCFALRKASVACFVELMHQAVGRTEHFR